VFPYRLSAAGSLLFGAARLGMFQTPPAMI